MPIYVNEADGSKTVHFGTGDLIVGTDKGSREVICIFDEVHRGNVGDPASMYEGKSTTDIKGQIVRLVFDNESSVDVLIDCLLRVKSRIGAETILASMEAEPIEAG